MEDRFESLNVGAEEELRECSEAMLPLKEEGELDSDDRKFERLVQEKEDDYAVLLRESVMESSAELDLKEEQLALVQKSIEECRKRRQVEEQRLLSLERDIEERSKELQNKEKQVGSIQGRLSLYCRDIETKEMEYGAIRRSIEESNKELEAKGEQLKSIQKLISDCERQLRLKEEECNWQLETVQQVIVERDEVHKKMQKKIEGCDRDLEAKEARLSLIEGLIREREEELKTKDIEFHRVLGDIDKDRERKEEELRVLLKKIAECNRELKRKEEELDAMHKLVNGQAKEVGLKRKGLLKSMLEKMNQLVQELRSNKKDLDSLKRLMKERSLELEKKDEQLEDGVKGLESMKKQFEGRVKGLESKEKQYEAQVKKLKSKEKQFEGRVKELESKEKQFEERAKALESKEEQFEGRVKELESKQKHFEGQVKELESKEKQFEERAKEHKSKENNFEVRVKVLELKEKQFKGRAKELESKGKQYEGRAKELESNERQYEGRLQELKSKEKQFEVQANELESKQKQFEEQVKDLESKQNQYEGQVKELELKETQFKVQVKELESKEKQFEGQVKDLESKQNQFEGQLKELELKEKQYESLSKSFEEEKVLKEKSNILLNQVKTEQLYFKDAYGVNNSKNLQVLFNLLKKYELVCSQVYDALRTSAEPAKLVLDAMKGFYPPYLRQENVEYDANILSSIFNLLMDELKKSSAVTSFHVKQEAMKLASEWKANIAVTDKDCLEVLGFLKFVATYEIGSSFNANELKRLLDIIAQHFQAEQALGNIEKLPDNQLSPTTDGRNLQLLLNEQTNEPEMIGNDILINLQTSSDPAKLVLDIIQNPIVPKHRKGDKGVSIDGSHIFLLEHLMRISPHIKPHVREEAMKLALDLKANMIASTENSSVVLGFLLLLSVYGLVSSFNEDEVLKLFELTAQHKQAVELFRTLGFVDKISDYVQNLVKKKQHIEAVRFICAYKLADKVQPVDLLREYVQKAKLISKRFCRKTKWTEKKIKGRDIEIASLAAVLQCISDNNLESQDLVTEIEDRILGLERQKENIIRFASEPSSNVKVQQPEEKKRADEAVTENQVKGQQAEEKKHANEAVTHNQVEVQQPEEKKRANEAVTKNQVKVQQPEEKKRANEAVTNNHQLQQWANNSKRPRTAVTPSVPSVFTPQYQHLSMPCHERGIPRPSGMPSQFGFPPSHFGLANPIGVGRFGNSGTNYFCHSGPYPRYS